ncbi:unnamed protein product [Calicophoron daubneyi]|uniref:Uncharacterized protein n=1 Tax=Calicophoron daubneyi TaxID=300641 RepID=A0AAV2T9U1_CALDB
MYASVLSLPELFFLAGVGSVYAVFAVTWFLWYTCKCRKGGNIADSTQILFFGGGRFIHNAVFLGIAASHLILPRVDMTRDTPALYAVMICASRVLAFITCTIYWNHLAKLRFKSTEEYLLRRLEDNIPVYAHLINRIIAVCSLLLNYVMYCESNGVFSVKSLLPFIYLMISFGSFSALGGVNVILFGCTVLWVIEISGEFLLLTKTLPYFPKSGLFQRIVSECGDLYSPNLYIMGLAELLTVQPLYTLFQSASSASEANAAMGIAVVLAVFGYALSFLTARCLEGHSGFPIENNTEILHRIFGVNFDGSNQFTALDNPDEVTTITFTHLVILLGTRASNTIAFLLLHAHSISVHVYQYALPNWLRLGLVSDGRELHMTYSCLFLLTSYTLTALMMYSSNKLDAYIPNTPRTAVAMMLAVATVVMVSPLVREVWHVPTSVTIALFTLIGVIISHQDPVTLIKTCTPQWFATIIFVPSLLVCIVLSAFLKGSKTANPNLLFRTHLKLRKEQKSGHTNSIVSKENLRIIKGGM